MAEFNAYEFDEEKDENLEQEELVQTRKFSLIELLMIIMLVGIIFTLIVPLRNDKIYRQKVREAVYNLQYIAKVDKAFHDNPDNGYYAYDLSMLNIKKFLLAWGVLFFIINASILSAQDTTMAATESMVKVTGKVDQKQVPLNRFLKFTVRIEWTGDISRYQISELEDPIINNFEIYSTSSADYRMKEAGVDKAAKTYEFLLKPQSLGMGYIEGVMVKYIDNVTGEGHHLVTNRIDVEVIESVPEPGSKNWIYKWIVLLALIIAVAMVIGFEVKKRRERRQKEAEKIQIVPLEEEYLTTLKNTLDLKKPDLVLNEAFWTLSKIFRKYLAQKYDIAALELTTDELLSILSEKIEDESLANMAQEVLTVCDVAKFAGSNGDQNQLVRVYTLVESILEKNLANNKKVENEGKESK